MSRVPRVRGRRQAGSQAVVLVGLLIFQESGISIPFDIGPKNSLESTPTSSPTNTIVGGTLDFPGIWNLDSFDLGPKNQEFRSPQSTPTRSPTNTNAN